MSGAVLQQSSNMCALHLTWQDKRGSDKLSLHIVTPIPTPLSKTSYIIVKYAAVSWMQVQRFNVLHGVTALIDVLL